MKIKWSPDFAYALGLIVSDGCLAKDGRHINFTSKDKELVLTFKRCLGLTNHIGRKSRGNEKIKKYYYVQFGSKNYCEFLLDVGLTPAKSRTLGALNIDMRYFIDFFRGCFDGDGNINIASHPESIHPQLRIRMVSASLPFLEWLKDRVECQFEVRGGWIGETTGAYVLTYAKEDSLVILNNIYYPGVRSFLKRKFFKAKPFLRV